MENPARKYAPLLTPGRQMAVRRQERAVSPRAVSEFLEAKIVQLMDRRNSLLEEKNGIIESRDMIPEQDFQRQLEATFDEIRPTVRDLRMLSQSKRVIEQDLEEDLENTGSKRARQNEPDIGFYERAYANRAYANSLVPRVMGSSVKQSKVRFTKHDQADFRANVLRYYDALHEDLAWCVITGIWMPKELVKAAHLVPKALSSQEVSFIFGAEEVVSKSPRNGLPLHKAVEAALDSGRIVIIPILDGTPMRWKCVLVDQECRQNTIFCTPGENPKPIIWDVCMFPSHLTCPANISQGH